jgi:hypothetical protein
MRKPREPEDRRQEMRKTEEKIHSSLFKSKEARELRE